jgi:hypothetical protein
MSQDKIRMDHMVMQYIWALENDSAFMAKAKMAAEKSNFNEFRRLVGSHIAPTRAMLGEHNSTGIASLEWSFLYMEMWMRLRWRDGVKRSYPDQTAADEKDFLFHIDRLNDAGYIVTMKGVAEMDAKRKTAEAKMKPNPIEPIDTQENEMSKEITITRQTLINGADVSKMTDDQLIFAIKQVEKEIEELKAVKTKSKKIAQRIEDASKTLGELVELLDNR